MFIKKIFQDKTDEDVHSRFVRFGKGRYEGRAVISFHKTDKIKVKGSYEFANDFVNFLSDLGNLSFSGIILSREELGLEGGRKKAGVYEYSVNNIDNSKVKEIKDKVYCFLLDVDSPDIKLKIKKKLPKPGKSPGKLDDKFCQLELDLRFWDKVKEEFFWDVPDVRDARGIPEHQEVQKNKTQGLLGFKKAKISHSFIIEEIVIPQGEKDFEKVRLLARRKGKIIRKIEIDGKEIVSEKDFEA